jgi:ethanolamine utilization protein EutM
VSDWSAALGLLEVHGFTAAVAAADAMSKAADVELGTSVRIGDGLVTVVASGQIAAVQEAVASGIVAAERVGRVVARHVIGRPSQELRVVFALGATGPRPGNGAGRSAIDDR